MFFVVNEMVFQQKREKNPTINSQYILHLLIEKTKSKQLQAGLNRILSSKHCCVQQCALQVTFSKNGIIIMCHI